MNILTEHYLYLKNYQWLMNFRVITFLYFRPIINRKLWRFGIHRKLIIKFRLYLKVSQGIYWVEVIGKKSTELEVNGINLFVQDHILAYVKYEPTINIIKKVIPEKITLTTQEYILLEEYKRIING